MKQLIITIVIVFGMSIGAFSQDRGLFGYGETKESSAYRENNSPFLDLPKFHGESDDQGAPLGSGTLLLLGFGAAYVLKKNKKGK